MISKNIIILLLAIFVSSCASPKYLKSSDKIDVNECGSHIKVFHKSASKIEGEFIAIQDEKLVVFESTNNTCVLVPIEDVKKFKLRYAKPKHYGWSIPVLTLSTITHGWFLFLTAPINLIVTISVTVGGENAFSYKGNDISYGDLEMFARFPQGIPSTVALEDIKPYVKPATE